MSEKNLDEAIRDATEKPHLKKMLVEQPRRFQRLYDLSNEELLMATLVVQMASGDHEVQVNVDLLKNIDPSKFKE